VALPVAAAMLITWRRWKVMVASRGRRAAWARGAVALLLAVAAGTVPVRADGGVGWGGLALGVLIASGLSLRLSLPDRRTEWDRRRADLLCKVPPSGPDRARWVEAWDMLETEEREALRPRVPNDHRAAERFAETVRAQIVVLNQRQSVIDKRGSSASADRCTQEELSRLRADLAWCGQAQRSERGR
jgi:hypothetical protein